MWHDPTFESIFLTCLIYAHPTKNKNEEKKIITKQNWAILSGLFKTRFSSKLLMDKLFFSLDQIIRRDDVRPN